MFPDADDIREFKKTTTVTRGVARIFQRGGGITLCQSEGTHLIVMSFLLPVRGCLFKKG